MGRFLYVSFLYRFDTVLRFRYRVPTQKKAMPCEGLRISKQIAKLLKEPDVREFRHGIGRIFPSWTSRVRIPSPAIPFRATSYKYSRADEVQLTWVDVVVVALTTMKQAAVLPRCGPTSARCSNPYGAHCLSFIVSGILLRFPISRYAARAACSAAVFVAAESICGCATPSASISAVANNLGASGFFMNTAVSW